MTNQDFISEVKKVFKNYFPNGSIFASKYTMGGGIYFSCKFFQPEDFPFNISQNDIMSLNFGIHENVPFDGDVILPLNSKIVVEFQASSFNVNPVNQYFAMSSVKVSSRKINNVPTKVILALEKHFKKFKEAMDIEMKNENLYGQKNFKEKYLK